MSTPLNAWKCPNCDWYQTGHPTYGWQQTDTAAVRVHQERLCPAVQRPKAKVILFKSSGKYYTEEEWRVPTEEEARKFQSFSPGDMVVPYCMKYSPDFRRIGDGFILVVSQEPWGYPHLL